MSTGNPLAAPPAELATLYAIETPLPPVPDDQRAALLDRLAQTLGWGSPPAGGSGGAAAAKVGGALLLIAAATGGMIVLGTRASNDSTPPVNRSSWPPHAAGARTPDNQELPPWVGDASRPSRTIAGRVEHAGAPIAGARVVLQSYASRAGLTEALVQLTDADGSFDFGPHRAATYDVTGTSPGLGYGHIRANTYDPTEAFDALTITLSGCEHGLHGQVRDASGGVIAGAEVRPGRGKNSDITTVGTAAVTDEAGRYTLCTWRGPVVAIAIADGYGGVVAKDHVDGWRRLDFDLLPAGTVVGRVVGSDGDEPIEGARIWLNPSELRGRTQTLGAIASSDAEGRFSFEGVAPGRHWLWADAEPMSGYGSVVVGPAQQSQQVVLALASRGGVSGTVVHDGKPVSGAQIGYRINGWPRGGTAIADEHGRFTLHNTGRVVIEFDVVDYEVISPLTHEAGDLDTPVVVRVSTAGRIDGRVTLGGTPITGASVTAHHDERGLVASVDSDQHGAFALQGLPAGAYTLRAHSDERQAFVTRRTQPVITVGSDDVHRDVLLELDGAATISGTVIDQDGQPVAGVEVEFREPSDDQCRALTRDDGSFLCTMLAGAAEYSVVVRQAPRSPVYLAPANEALPSVRVPHGDSVISDVVLRVQLERAQIAGRVVARGGGALPDAYVRALPSTTEYTPHNAPWIGFSGDVSDADGQFSIEVWGSQPYTVHAQSPGGGAGVVAEVSPRTDDLVVVVEQPGGVSGTLKGFADRPYVWAKPIGDSEEVLMALVDRERFSLDGLAPGRYAVVATTGARAAGEMVTVSAGHTTELALSARTPAGLGVKVVDFISGSPVAGVKCLALPYMESAGVFGIGVQADSPTDAEGRTRINAPTGTVEVTCVGERPHHSDGAGRVVVAASETAEIEIPVLTSIPKPHRKGVGATILFGHREPSGHSHTIGELRPGSTAEAAGLRVGDVIIAIDGRDVTPLIEVDSVWQLYSRGDRVVVMVERDGKRVRKSVAIQAR